MTAAILGHLACVPAVPALVTADTGHKTTEQPEQGYRCCDCRRGATS